MKKLFSLFALLLIALGTASAQDFSFSQYHYTPFLTNPAAVGTGDHVRAWVNYRRQQLQAGDPLNSPMVSVTSPFFQGKGGLGLHVVNDRQGTGLITTGALLAGNYQIAFDGHQLSLGLQAGLLNRRVNLDGLTTNSQYQGGAFDPSLPINEDIETQSRGYPVFGGGAYWMMPGERHHEKAFLGLAALNLNQPDASFIAEAENNIPMRLIASGGVQVWQQGKFTLVPNARYVFTNSYHFANLGAWWRFALDGGSGFAQRSTLSLGTWYHTNGFGTASIEWESDRAFAALSYDVPFDTEAQTFQDNGVIELTLGIKFLRKYKKGTANEPTAEAPPVPPTPQPQAPEKEAETTPQPEPPNPPQPAPDVAPQPTPQPEKPLTQAEREKRIKEYYFSNVQFEKGSDALTPESIKALEAVVEAMLEDPSITLLLTGHTCDLGEEALNSRLSLERAESVKQKLIDMGIAPDRISTKGAGPNDPYMPNTDEESRQYNRRVEFEVKR